LQSRIAPRDGVKFGLNAEYFSDRDATFQHPLRQQVDPTIDFYWGELDPVKFDRPADLFTVRWTGSLTPPLAGEWTFDVSAGDSMRIWLDDQMIFDRWERKPFYGERIKRELGSRPYSLKVEYAETGGVAFARLRWMPPGETTEKPIPAGALRPEGPDSGGAKDSLYLSTLKPVEIRVFPQSKLDEEITIKGVKSLHGIYMHPNHQEGARVVYLLPRAYQSISGAVALKDSSTGAQNPLTFRIVMEGQTLWKSKPIQNYRDSEEFDVALPAAKKIELVVDCPGRAGRAHAAWVDPRLVGPIGPSDSKKSGSAVADQKRSRDTRKKWINETYHSSIVYVEGDDWNDVDDKTGKVTLNYKEKARNSESVELYCPEREYTIRLLNNRLVIRMQGKNQFSPAATGHWAVE
jgi:hypothetical protein